MIYSLKFENKALTSWYQSEVLVFDYKFVWDNKGTSFTGADKLSSFILFIKTYFIILLVSLRGSINNVVILLLSLQGIQIKALIKVETVLKTFDFSNKLGPGFAIIYFDR